MSERENEGGCPLCEKDYQNGGVPLSFTIQTAGCSLCRFWMPFPDELEKTGAGHCHRLPPAMGGFVGAAHWPVCTKDDWCGEFKAKCG